jgi:unsaturated rhamnogalacturonyl hydrolase
MNSNIATPKIVKRTTAISFIISVVLISAGCASTALKKSVSSQQEKWSQNMVESHGLRDFYTNRVFHEKLSNTGWDYVSGLVASAVLKAWERYPDKTAYYDAVKSFADRNTNADGSMIIHASGRSALGPSNIDDLAAGRIFFTLYKEEMKRGNSKAAERYKNAATVVRNKLKYDHARIKEGLPGAGGFYHKAVYPSQMWLDGLYMGVPVYAQWQSVFGTANAKENQESWSDIARQFKIIHQNTYNGDKQLNYHAWSATPTDSNSFWANKTGPYLGCSKEFWGRGMGWYFAALVDVLEFMPKEHPDYSAVLAICNQVAAGLKRWQDKESGVWFQLLQYDSTMKGDGQGDVVNGKTYNRCTASNYLEASCSAMFTYALFKGVRLQLLNKSSYLPTAEKAYQGLLKTFIRKEDGRTDIIQSCASAGLGPARNPSRTGTINYYLCGEDVAIVKNEGKAIGPFIMASVEYENYLDLQ